MASAATTLKTLGRLVGNWATEATHPQLPGVVVRGTTKITWMDGEHFLLVDAKTDNPQFPNGMSIMGDMGHDRVEGGGGKIADATETARWQMHYYDSRGVFRILDLQVDDTTWRLQSKYPGFSQRFTGTFSDDGKTIDGLWQLCRDEVHWADDLKVTYRR